MVLVVAPNPSLDKTIILPGFEPGQISRPSEILTLAGGKGFNFARALNTSGCPALSDLFYRKWRRNASRLCSQLA
jgi:fructose-1-phosphate kinase PfkB-like protein